jgi:amidase
MVHDFSLNDDLLLSTTPSWQNVQRKKKRQQEEALDRWRMTWGSKEMPELTMDWKSEAGDKLDVTFLLTSTLSSREREIVNMDATALLERLHHSDLDSPDRYTAVEVTMAVCKVSTVAHALTNSLTEIFFCDAMTRATELDKYRRDHKGGIVGPLHGLPVSVKDHIFMKGLDTSTGYIAWANKSIADEDAPIVDILRKAGAVLYVKTANPQTLLVRRSMCVCLSLQPIYIINRVWKRTTTYTEGL